MNFFFFFTENGPLEDNTVNLDSTIDTSVLDQTVVNSEKTDSTEDNVDSNNIPNNKLPNRTDLSESHPDWPPLPHIKGYGESVIPGLGDLDQLEGTKKDEESSETKEQDKNMGDNSEKQEDTGTEEDEEDVDMTNEEIDIIKNFNTTDSKSVAQQDETLKEKSEEYNPYALSENNSQEEDMDVDNVSEAVDGGGGFNDDLSTSMQQAAQEVAKYEAQPEFVDEVEDQEDQVYAHEVTSIKQSPVLRGHLFLVLS